MDVEGPTGGCSQSGQRRRHGHTKWGRQQPGVEGKAVRPDRARFKGAKAFQLREELWSEGYPKGRETVTQAPALGREGQWAGKRPPLDRIPKDQEPARSRLQSRRDTRGASRSREGWVGRGTSRRLGLGGCVERQSVSVGTVTTG